MPGKPFRSLRFTSFQRLLAANHQRGSTAATKVTTLLADQCMTLAGKWELLLRALAAIDIAVGLATNDFVVVAAIGWQLVDAAHDQLPFLSVGLDARAIQLVRHQMGHFMGHGLLQKVLGVGSV